MISTLSISSDDISVMFWTSTPSNVYRHIDTFTFVGMATGAWGAMSLCVGRDRYCQGNE